MTENNDTEASEAQGQNSGSGEESDLVKDLRRQLKQRPSREELESEIREQVKREIALESKLEGFKVPKTKGFRSDVEEQLGDAEITEESVAEALKSLGVEVAGAGSEQDDSDDDAADTQALSEVSNLSGQLTSAASESDLAAIDKRLEKAQSAAEVDEIMREAGLLR